jgi:hypothetical protein
MNGLRFGGIDPPEKPKQMEGFIMATVLYKGENLLHLKAKARANSPGPSFQNRFREQHCIEQGICGNGEFIKS